MKELNAIVRTLVSSGGAGSVLATLVSVEGSSYRRAGARLLLMADGSRVGSISGGCLEEDLLARAKQVAACAKGEVVLYDTTSENDLVWGAGLGCHGVVKVLVEPLPAHVDWAGRIQDAFTRRESAVLVARYDTRDPELVGTRFAAATPPPQPGCFVQHIAPPTKLVIFGAGDDALPLAHLAAELGWLVTVCDPRPAYADPRRFVGATVITGNADGLVERAALDAYSVAVVMTHHYVHDVPLLRALLPTNLPYVGLLGPRKRAEKILADLATSGLNLSSEQRRRLHAPVGLDLGADGPEQVALAIVAEIQAALAGRDGRPLRERDRPIHT